MTSPNIDRPGGEVTKRELHFIWIADCSGSMGINGKIQALNEAIRESIPHMIEAKEENQQAEVLVRAVSFSDVAEWHVQVPTPVKQFRWEDLELGGGTNMGEAIHLVAQEMQMPPMPKLSLPPVLVLISDGLPNDENDFDQNLQYLMSQPWGLKAVRLAIPIGDDCDLDVLRKFIGNSEIEPIPAKNAEQLKAQIKFFSTVAIKAVSNPPSMQKGQSSAQVFVPSHLVAANNQAGVLGVDDVF